LLRPDPRINFLYFEKKGFGIGGIRKDVSDISPAGQRAEWREPRVKHTCLKSQMQVSLPYGCYDAVWNNAFVGPSNFRSKN